MPKTHVQQALGEPRRARSREVATRTIEQPVSSQDALAQHGIVGPSTAEGLAPSQLRFFQRTLGNRAVGRLIQAKRTVTHADDSYEPEADLVAGPSLHLRRVSIPLLEDEESAPFVEPERQVAATQPAHATIQRRADASG